jgi:hypothetical protein
MQTDYERDGYNPMTMFAAPRPWVLDDSSSAGHPYVAIRSAGRANAIAYKYSPSPSEVRDFELIVAAVNAADFSHLGEVDLTAETPTP